MTDTIWSVLAGIVAGIFSGTISARITLQRMQARLTGGSQMAGPGSTIRREDARQSGQSNYAYGSNAKIIGRDENNYGSH